MNNVKESLEAQCPINHQTINKTDSINQAPLTQKPTTEEQNKLGIRPPVVSGHPLFKNTIDIFTRPQAFFQEMHQLYGEAFQVRALTKKYIVLAGADANRFMTGEGKHFFSSEKTWGKGIKKFEVIIAVDGAIHKEQRNFLNPALAKAKYKNRLEELAYSVEKTLENYEDGVHLAGPFMRHIVSHQLGDAMLDPSIPKPNQIEIERIIYITNSFLSVSILGKPWITLLKPSVIRSAFTSIGFCIAHRKAILKSNKAGSSSEFSQQMLSGPESHSGWYNKFVGLGYTLLPFFAGLDTMGATLNFAMYELIKNPQVQKRIQDEVDENFQSENISLDTLDEMKDLMGFVYETMRMHPIAFGMNRSATEDFRFKNYKIKKGEQVIIYTATNHFNDKYFKNPQVFDIERYREPRKEHRKDGVFAPFGKGPHTCPAAGLSELLLAVNIAVLLKNFSVSEAIKLNHVQTIATPAPALSDNFTIKIKRRERE